MIQAQSTSRTSERGAVAILMAFAIVAVIGMSALAIDIGSALVTKAELQNASDAGTLAGTRELALVYKELGVYTSYKDYTLTTTDKARIQAKVSSFSKANLAAGTAVSILASDLVYGTYNKDSSAIAAQSKGVKAVQLRARRDNSVNGALQMTTARVLGIQTMEVTAVSGATLTPLGSVPAGTGEIPIAISSHWFETRSCEDDRTIKFFPTGSSEGCAGWHTFDEYPASAARLGKILGGLTKETYTTPAITAGETYFNFTGGAVASKFSDMKALYDSRKDSNGDWTVMVPVYQDSSCANPNGATLIVGFAKARIHNVRDAPDLTIDAEVQCGIVEVGTGNGANDYGTLYALPGMVQ